MQTFVYRGDSGKFRKALASANFPKSSTSMIFNDLAKVKGYRRLKLWMARSVVEAPQEQQEKLLEELKKEFGDRFISVYVTKTAPYGTSSLCVRIKP